MFSHDTCLSHLRNEALVPGSAASVGRETAVNGIFKGGAVRKIGSASPGEPTNSSRIMDNAGPRPRSGHRDLSPPGPPNPGGLARFLPQRGNERRVRLRTRYRRRRLTRGEPLHIRRPPVAGLASSPTEAPSETGRSWPASGTGTTRAEWRNRLRGQVASLSESLHKSTRSDRTLYGQEPRCARDRWRGHQSISEPLTWPSPRTV